MFKTNKAVIVDMPEPDWYLVMSADGSNVNVELRASDEDAVNAALDMGGMVEIHRLITIDKAEAKVREALEAALENARELCAEKAELERIIGQQAETIRVQMAERDAMKLALEAIAVWEPPQVLSKGEIVPMVIAIGSRGEQDYFRDIARAALAQGQGQGGSDDPAG